MAFTHPSKWHLQKGWGPDRLNGFSSQQEGRPKVTMGITRWILMQFTQHDSPSSRAAKTYHWQTLSIDVNCASVVDTRRERLLTVSSKGQLNKPLIIFFYTESFSICLFKRCWEACVLNNNGQTDQPLSGRISPKPLCGENQWTGFARRAGLEEIAFKWIVKSSAQMVWLNSKRERVTLIGHHNSSLTHSESHPKPHILALYSNMPLARAFL